MHHITEIHDNYDHLSDDLIDYVKDILGSDVDVYTVSAVLAYAAVEAGNETNEDMAAASQTLQIVSGRLDAEAIKDALQNPQP